MSTAQIRDLVLRLPSNERAFLARELIESLEPEDGEADIESAWLEEIEARADSYDRGEAAADDWMASLNRVREELRKGPQP